MRFLDLAVRLRMIGSRKQFLDTKYLAYLLEELGRKLPAVVRQQLGWRAEVKYPVFNECARHRGGGNVLEGYSLRQLRIAVVYHEQVSVALPGGIRKRPEDVDSDILEGCFRRK